MLKGLLKKKSKKQSNYGSCTKSWKHKKYMLKKSNLYKKFNNRTRSTSVRVLFRTGWEEK